MRIGTSPCFVGVLLLVITAAGAKKARKPSIKCNTQIGKLKPYKVTGVLPDAMLKSNKPLASYQTSNMRKCLIGCLFHKSKKCRAIALTRMGNAMACLLYSVSHVDNPERFKKLGGTIYSEIRCDYQELMTVVKVNETATDRGILYDKYRPDLFRPLKTTVRKVFLDVKTQDDCYVKGTGHIKVHENIQWRKFYDKNKKQNVKLCQILSLSQ